jgi:4-amino-4-deoxy-L-arabinose transferase-like glycosyltransferase
MGLRKAGQTCGRRRIDSFFPVLAVALLLRAAWALAVPVQPVSDSGVYNLLARNLANGIGYCWGSGNPTAYWPVGTSFVYSVFFRVFGLSYAPIVIFNIVISLATIWLSMLLAKRWFNRKVALVAGYLAACWPVQIEFTTVLASELIFNFLLVALLAVWEWEKLNPWVKAVLIGLLSAAACYVRPIAMLLPVILYALSINRERKYTMPVARAVVAMLAMALAIAPWSQRNTRIFGNFEIISTNGGPNLWMGNNPASHGGTTPLPADVVKMPEGARDLYLGHIAKTYIREYPGSFLLRTLKKAVLLHNHETIGVHWNMPTLESRYGQRAVWLLKLGSDLFWWAALLLGMAGTSVITMRHGIWALFSSPPAALWAYFIALHAVIVTQDRYHFPCLPFIGMLAAVALCAMWERWIAKAKWPE